MEKSKLLEIASDVENKSNKDLLDAEEFLFSEHEGTKELIIGLTRHLDSVEELYNKISEEIIKRKG